MKAKHANAAHGQLATSSEQASPSAQNKFIVHLLLVNQQLVAAIDSVCPCFCLHSLLQSVRHLHAMLKSQVFDSALDMLGEQGMDRLMQGACTEYAVGTNYHKSKSPQSAIGKLAQHLKPILWLSEPSLTCCNGKMLGQCTAYQYAHACFDVQWLCSTTHTH